MSPFRTKLLETVGQPEYVGENRCVPCTVVNLVIAAILGALVTVVSIPGGVATFALCVGIIALRGYLVPGTPTMTRRYFPPMLLGLFGKRAEAETESAGTVTGEEVVEFCLEAGLLADDGEGDVHLTASFREAWNDRIRALRERDERRLLADAFDIDPAPLSLEENNGWFVVYRNGEKFTHWRTKAAFIADVAAERELSERVDGWQEMDQLRRGEILRRLRVTMLDCPLCDAALGIRQTTGCCPGEEAVVVDCTECDAIVFEEAS